MDPKKWQLPTSTGQSLEKILRLLGINLSSYMGRLYGFTLMILFFMLSQISWHDICTKYCEEHLIKKFMVTLEYILYVLLVLTTMGTSIFRPKQFAFPRQEMFIIDSIFEWRALPTTIHAVFSILYHPLQSVHHAYANYNNAIVADEQHYTYFGSPCVYIHTYIRTYIYACVRACVGACICVQGVLKILTHPKFYSIITLLLNVIEENDKELFYISTYLLIIKI
ncbi:hypothetical protein ACFW04_002522 [Cataglyphis niger]